jgi:hypothetical protein
MTKPEAMTNSTKMLIVGGVTGLCEVGALYLAALVRSGTTSHVAFALFFPVAFLLSIPFLRVLALAVIAMLAQFPVYGYLIGKAWTGGNLRQTTLQLLGFHVMAAIPSACSLMIAR